MLQTIESTLQSRSLPPPPLKQREERNGGKGWEWGGGAQHYGVSWEWGGQHQDRLLGPAWLQFLVVAFLRSFLCLSLISTLLSKQSTDWLGLRNKPHPTVKAGGALEVIFASLHLS